MSDAMQAETIRIAGHGGDEIEAYFARPTDEARRGGVVVIHHMPGYDAASKEIVRRFAVLGYDAICPNLHYREAPGAAPDDASAAVRAAGGVPDDRLVGDVGGAADYLRGQPTSNGKVGVIGYCSGGRQTVLAACSLTVDAAVDCYGAFVIGSPPAESPFKMSPVQDKLADLSCPLLGLFGAEDTHPAPAETAQLEELLKQHGKTYEFHTYENAGHGFFATDRQSYRVEAAAEGWDEIVDFFGQYLEA
jgi:carboxymethylenebutenolidase